MGVFIRKDISHVLILLIDSDAPGRASSRLHRQSFLKPPSLCITIGSSLLTANCAGDGSLLKILNSNVILAIESEPTIPSPMIQSTTGHLGHNGEGIVDGDFRDYQASELSLPDCKFSRYEDVFNEQIGSVESTGRRSMLSVEESSLTAFDCRHAEAGGFRCNPVVV